MAKQKHTLLVVDDDSGHRLMLQTLLGDWGFAAETAQDGAAAVAQAHRRPYDLILMDVRMAGVGGIEALRAIKAYNPAIPILIMTAYSTVETAVEALKAGAYDYLTKPLDFDVLRLALARALDHATLRSENRALRDKLSVTFDPGEILGSSPPMKKLLDMLAMIAPSEATALITGESGAGKELVARALHDNSPRRSGPFVAVNCAALAETLLESELFGHERGAFTGAERRREGRFLLADKGTIFLDEIGELSLAMQVKLLRVIQEREIERVGGDQTVKVNVRILAASNRDLKEEVAVGRFRQDLYFRLNVVTLTVPPLRERVEDIPLLAKCFLDKYATKNRKTVQGFTPRAMDCLLKHPWPGNVRELENAVERGVVLLVGEYVSERELPASVAQAGSDDILPTVCADGALATVERVAVLGALEAAHGNKSEAARRLGITRKTLHAKLRRYGEE